MARLEKAIYKIFFDCLKLTPVDSCLILVDEATSDLGHLFFEKAKKSKAEVALLKIKSPTLRSLEPAPPI
jgi:hypothetical protein